MTSTVTAWRAGGWPSTLLPVRKCEGISRRMGDDSHRLRATGGDSPRFAKYLFQLLVPASIHFSVLLTVLIVLSLVVITTNNGRQPWAFQGSLSECALIRCPTVLTRMGRLRGPGVFLGPRGYTSGTYSSRIDGAKSQVKVRCHSAEDLSVENFAGHVVQGRGARIAQARAGSAIVPCAFAGSAALRRSRIAAWVR